MQGRLWWVLAPRALCISLTWPEKLAASVESPRFCIELHGMDQPERRKATSAWPYPGVLCVDLRQTLVEVQSGKAVVSATNYIIMLLHTQI